MKSLVQFIKERLHYSFGIQFPGILEMAQVNNYDNSGPFSKNSMKVHIYGGSSEHNPPHVHIMDKSNSFDIRVLISNGELYSVKKGRKKESYSRIIKDFKEWLNEPSSAPKSEGQDNRDRCCLLWNELNPDKEIKFIDNHWKFE